MQVWGPKRWLIENGRRGSVFSRIYQRVCVIARGREEKREWTWAFIESLFPEHLILKNGLTGKGKCF